MATESVLDSQQALAARIRKDRLRTDLQTPISPRMYCVLYLKNGREHQSPRFSRRDHALTALELMQAKYGQNNAMIYLD